MINNQQLLTDADGICNEKLDISTRSRYTRFFNQFKGWIAEHHAEYLDAAGDVVLGNISDEAFKEFLAHKTKKTNPNGTYIIPEKFQSYEHVSGYKSAIVYGYDKARVSLKASTIKMFKEFFAGYRRKIGQLKQNGEMKLKEGKDALSFTGYRFMSWLAVRQDRDFNQSIFSWVFLLLCWNLISRCVSVSSLMYDHIWWEMDALVIVFPTHKGDKDGENSLSSPKHVYANPTNPEICPILALGVYMFCLGTRRDGAKRMVFGDKDNIESRFSNWLRAALGSHSPELLLMGIAILEIGTHSFRKGVASFLCALVGGPTAIAIYLRAGWSLGPVQSRYILEVSGGDHLCGRAATGLSIIDLEFASLPPHFDLSSGDILSVQEWDLILPGYSNNTVYPDKFRQVMPFLLASIVYHKDWIVLNFPARHPLFLTSLWTSGIMDRLIARVYAGTMKNPVTKLAASGIPPHILLANELCNVRSELTSIKDQIIVKLDALPDLIKENLLRNFQINGVLPISREDVQSMIALSTETVLSAIQSSISANNEAIRTMNNNNNASNSATDNITDFQLFQWGGRFHHVPEGFEFPKVTAFHLWNLWFNGNRQQRIAPYRKLEPYDLTDRKNKHLLSRGKMVMKKIIARTGLTETNIATLDAVRRNQVFEVAFFSLYADMFPAEEMDHLDKRRVLSMSYTTMYDHLSKLN